MSGTGRGPSGAGSSGWAGGLPFSGTGWSAGFGTSGELLRLPRKPSIVSAGRMQQHTYHCIKVVKQDMRLLVKPVGMDGLLGRMLPDLCRWTGTELKLDIFR